MWSDYSHEHTKRPDVRFAAELAVFDDLRRRPLDRELGTLGARVLIIKHKPAEQKSINKYSQVSRMSRCHWLRPQQQIHSAHTHLVIPKSDTFTSLFSETRQFLAACRHRGRLLSGDRRAKWWMQPPSARLPDLCGGSWSSPGRPSPRWRPCTCSATSPETKCLSWPAGSRRGSHSPWTRTPGTGGNAGCSQRRVEPACGVTASCQMQKFAELSHRPNAIGTSCEMPLHHNPGLLLQIVFRHAPFSDHFHRHLLRLPPTFQHEPELTAAYLLTQGQFIGVQLPLICSTEARWWTEVAKQWKHQIHSEPSNLQREQKLAGHHFHLEIQGVSSGLSDLSGR